MQADDGAVIDILNRGYFRAEPEVVRRLNAGEPVDNAEYYLRTAPVFQTDAPAHRWLCEHQFIGLGRQESPRRLSIDFFVLL